MYSVDKGLAEQVIASNGRYKGCPKPVIAIVKYTNRWDEETFGLVYEESDFLKYRVSPYVRNPTTYWGE